MIVLTTEYCVRASKLGAGVQLFFSFQRLKEEYLTLNCDEPLQTPPVGNKCVQIGTHGDGLSAETEEMSLSPGAPDKWTPGACPAEYGQSFQTCFSSFFCFFHNVTGASKF